RVHREAGPGAHPRPRRRGGDIARRRRPRDPAPGERNAARDAPRVAPHPRREVCPPLQPLREHRFVDDPHRAPERHRCRTRCARGRAPRRGLWRWLLLGRQPHPLGAERVTRAELLRKLAAQLDWPDLQEATRLDDDARWYSVAQLAILIVPPRAHAWTLSPHE